VIEPLMLILSRPIFISYMIWLAGGTGHAAGRQALLGTFCDKAPHRARATMVDNN